MNIEPFDEFDTIDECAFYRLSKSFHSIKNNLPETVELIQQYKRQRTFERMFWVVPVLILIVKLITWIK